MIEFVVEKKLLEIGIVQVRVIEFQKRGLSHARCIFILESVSKNTLRSPEAVDNVISAEIAPVSDTVLRDEVLQHMIHNPCGEHNPSSVYMGEWGCKKVPAQFVLSANHSENENYISYMRPRPKDGGEQANLPFRGNPNQVVDNSLVVPYNSVLLMMILCHLNVELCVSRVGGIKYLFNYICKVSDRVKMQIASEFPSHNEGKK